MKIGSGLSAGGRTFVSSLGTIFITGFRQFISGFGVQFLSSLLDQFKDYNSKVLNRKTWRKSNQFYRTWKKCCFEILDIVFEKKNEVEGFWNEF